MHWNVGVENSVLQDIPLLFIYEFENGLSIWPEPPEQTFLYVMSHAQRQQTKMPEAAVHSGAKHPKIQRFTFNIRYPLLRQSAKMSVQELKRIQSPHREYHPGFFFFFLLYQIAAAFYLGHNTSSSNTGKYCFFMVPLISKILPKLYYEKT